MTRAARNVSNDSNSDELNTEMKKFGHLHIIFRDWQSTDTNTQSVFNALFNNENTEEASIRNQIRSDVKASFLSVNVWLFDAPTESTKALKTKLSYEICSPIFKSQVKELRNVLSEQLKTPTMFANNPLTGQTVGLLVNQIAQSLNAGETILPSSAYVNMMKQELDKIIQSINIEFTTQINVCINQLETDKSTNSLPSYAEANQRITVVLDTVLQRYQQSIKTTLGDVNSTLSQSIASDLPNILNDLKTKSIDYYLTSYKEILSRWLLNSVDKAEQYINKSINLLQNITVSMEISKLESKIEEIIAEAWKILTNERYEGEIVTNYAERLHRLVESKRHLLYNHNNQLIAKENAEIELLINELVSQGMIIMNQIIPKTFQQLLQTNNGFGLENIEKALNNEFIHVKSSIELNASNKKLSIETIKKINDLFRIECSKLRPIMLDTYNEVMTKAFHDVTTQSCNELMIAGQTEYQLNYSTENELIETINELIEVIIGNALTKLSDWTSTEEMDDLIESNIRQQGDILLSEAINYYQSKQTSMNADMEEDEQEIEIEDEQVDNDEEDYNVGSKRPAAKTSSTAQSQKEKARLYAISQGWIKDDKKKKITSTSTVSKKAATKVVNKTTKSSINNSLADIKASRQKARQWAIDNLGTDEHPFNDFADENQSPMNHRRTSTSSISSNNNGKSLLSPNEKAKIQKARDDAAADEQNRVSARIGPSTTNTKSTRRK